MTPDCEADLIRRAQAGDAAAEEELLRSFGGMRRGIASRYTPWAEGARRKEIEQAASMGSLFAIRRFDPRYGNPLASYVLQFARGYAQMERRRSNAALIAASTEWDGSELESPDAVEERVISQDLVQKVQEALEAVDLDSIDRAILNYRLVTDEPETLAEVGSRVGLSRESIRQREIRLTEKVLPRALRALR